MTQAPASLLAQQCVPCSGETKPLGRRDVAAYVSQLSCPWQVIKNRKITHEFSFKDFSEAMYFVNEVAAVAEGEGHHPDIHVHYKNVVIELWTHAINGLSPNDFIIASKIEMCR